MIFRFTTFRDGGNDAVSLDLPDAESARIEGCKLLEQVSRGAIGKADRREQVRVVASDAQGLDLFTIAFFVMPARMASRPCDPMPAMIDRGQT